MNYPVWDLLPGAGVLVAVVSVLHVFVSHFAIGGGLWLVVTEMRANRSGDEDARGFVKRHSRFFMLLTLVFGAISGVGIWATIGLVSPHGTSALIHAYVWGWAMEWVFFFVEIAAALVYYYGWTRLDRSTHVAVGWIYFVAAWMSLFVINGIITFMLTSGTWPATQSFWAGFFNPTFWPSLVIRTFAGVAIAGMFTLLTAAGLPRGGFRARMVRWNAAWACVGLLGVAASAWWYGGAIAPWRDNEALAGAIPVLPEVIHLFRIGLVAALLLALVPLVVPRAANRGLVGLLLLAGLGTMGAGEWAREAGRKPFVIQQYMYSTGMLVDDEARYEENGMAAGTLWISPQAAADEVRLGRDLYAGWCRPCHTMDGYNGLRPFLAHWTEETVASLVPRVGHMRALMPPWYGTDEENAALTAYLLTEKPAAAAVLPADPHAAQEKAFALSCGLCHTPDGYRPLRGSFTDMAADEISDFLDESGDLLDEMPGYHGTDAQRAALIEYLLEMDRPADETEGSAS